MATARKSAAPTSQKRIRSITQHRSRRGSMDRENGPVKLSVIAMRDSEEAVEPVQAAAARQNAIDALGVVYDPKVVDSISECIVDKVQQGVVEEGIPYGELVRDAGVPSWMAHQGLLTHVLVLVSLQSYQNDGLLLSALTCARKDAPPPSDGFCALLEWLGFVSSRDNREECLDSWDHHWKKVVMRLESLATGRDT